MNPSALMRSEVLQPSTADRDPTASPRPAPRPRPRPRPFGEGIDAGALTIRGVDYAARPFTGDEGEVGVALTKADGTVYHVVATAHGIECTCPDYIWTRAGRGEHCKHIRGVVGAGLSAGPAPATEALPARSFQAADLALWGFGYSGARLDAASTAIRRDNSAMTTPTIDDAHRERIEVLIPTRAERDETRRRHPAIKPGPAPARRGPTAEDFAYELGRSLGLEEEGPSPPPARHYTPAEREAFALGQVEASRVLDARAAMTEDDREAEAWAAFDRSHGVRHDGAPAI